MTEMQQKILDLRKQYPKASKTFLASQAGCTIAYVCQTLEAAAYHKMTKAQATERAHRSKPPVVQMFKPERFRNTACRFITFASWPNACGVETEGKTYCRECQAELDEAPVGKRYSFSTGRRSGSSKAA